MTDYRIFNIRCLNCRREGQLTIQTDPAGDWDYVITGFAGTVREDGPDLASLECLRCNAHNAALYTDDEGILGARVN